ncbi:cag pathogenicity island Cag12 family protein [Escherichia coli]
MIKHILVTVLVTLITGCSSPPPPVPVEWNKKPVSLNEKFPEWNPNRLIIKSPVINDKWTLSISSQDFNKEDWMPSVFYAIAHSTQITVATKSGADYFSAKNWLYHHGANGVIIYHPIINCLTCNETTIYFSR